MLLAALIAMQSITAMPAQSPVTLSVCEVLADDPTKLNGKVIAVRGLLVGTDEGAWLVGDCKKHLVTSGYTWGDTLWIYVDVSDESIERSWRKMSDTLIQLHADPQRDRISVTVVGQLETRKSMDDEISQGPNGPRPMGFGHLNGAPAEINVISVRNLNIGHRSRGVKRASKN
jgi:hypothetical protein